MTSTALSQRVTAPENTANTAASPDGRARVLFIGDTHANDEAPRWRNDNYLDACVSELAEALAVARDRRCDAIVHLGDVFQRPEPSGECRNRILKTFQQDEMGRPWPFRKFVVLGNHDIGNHIDNLGRSALGTLIYAGAVERVDGDEGLRLGFGHFRVGIEDELRGGCLLKKTPLIWALHAMVLTEKPPFNPYILFEELPLEDSCRMVIAGHYHPPLQHVRADGARFINPGSVCRRSLKADEKARQPAVLRVDYALDGSDFQTEFIPLASSLPADQIFDMPKAQARADQKAMMDRYLAGISVVATAATSDDIIDGLRVAGVEKNIPERVVARAIEAVERAQNG